MSKPVGKNVKPLNQGAKQLNVLHTGSDSSHLLTKNFVKPRRARPFTVASFAGAACVGGVYYLISTAIADQTEAQEALVGRLRRQPEINTSQAASVVPEFKAPSSYANLAERLNTKVKGPVDTAALAAEAHREKSEQPLLHQQIVLRSKTAWNTGIIRMQDALEEFMVRYRQRRIENCKRAVAARLAAQNFYVVTLREEKVTRV